MNLIVKGITVVSLVIMINACCEMAGNDACVLDGTERPLVNTPDYTVQEGDTIYSIAFAADKDYQELIAINHLKKPYRLKEGDVIILNVTRIVDLPKPDKLEQARIDLLEPDFAKLAEKNTPVDLPLPTQSDEIDHRQAKISQKQQVAENRKNAEKTMGNKSIVKNFDKKRVQVKKNTKVISSDADNYTRRSEIDAVTRNEAKGNLPIEAMKKPDSLWQWPTRGKVIGTFDSGRVGNKGLDITGDLGSPIRAAADGEVVYSGSGLRGYGNLIIIKHNTRYLSAYAYNQEILVTEGAKVRAGQVIAKMGRANSGEVMLHFEIRRAGKPVDPKQYLS